MIEFNKVKIGDIVTVYMNDGRIAPDQWIETVVLGRSFRSSREVETLKRAIKKDEVRELIVDLSGASLLMADPHDYTMLTFDRRTTIYLGRHNGDSIAAEYPKGVWNNWSVTVAPGQGGTQ